MKHVHISEIKVGDIILHNNKCITVYTKNIKRDPFIGITIFGDSYNFGNKNVTVLEPIEYF